MSSTNYSAGRPRRLSQDAREEIKLRRSYNPGRTSMRSAIRPGKSCHPYKRRDSEICPQMCSASWRGGFHTSKRCSRARIGGRVLGACLEAVDKALLPGCPMDLEPGSFHLPEHTQQACRFRLKAVVGEILEEVRTARLVCHSSTIHRVRLTANMADRCLSSSKAIP
jgi:hypothetical protein